MMEIGTTKQLFADDELIESVVHVYQVLNPGRKHEANPLVVSDRPWEESTVVYVYGTVVHDPKAAGKDRFRMWYNCAIPKYGSADHAGLLFAHSEDGIHWEKPNLGVARTQRVHR